MCVYRYHVLCLMWYSFVMSFRTAITEIYGNNIVYLIPEYVLPSKENLFQNMLLLKQAHTHSSSVVPRGSHKICVEKTRSWQRPRFSSKYIIGAILKLFKIASNKISYLFFVFIKSSLCSHERSFNNNLMNCNCLQLTVMIWSTL